ncbi:hypothetical protein SCUCBS95973_007951 [Sporothrix curviconia]|uniref:Uncharacterized protein n=1 Tax=Sporothrix curviconia TaxID=1260050 RepID=A0ABP0CHJ5_9PEZI
MPPSKSISSAYAENTEPLLDEMGKYDIRNEMVKCSRNVFIYDANRRDIVLGGLVLPLTGVP